MASLRIDNLRKEYDKGSIVAVDGLSLDIADGEFVTVVGPSGCGKTTTLRMIAGLERSTSGSIHIGDDDVTDQSARERDVAMVFQNYALYPHKTVAQNMGFGLRMSTDLSKEERDEKVRWAAEMMDIEELLEKKPGELSGGQKQRVALGRAIVREPAVFLFDEPLSNLDAKLRTTMRTEIQRLQNELDITAVYVTHDQEEAMTMGDRMVILRDGRLQQAGAPKHVYENPANRFVGGFVGSPSMNFVDVTASTTGGTTTLASDDLTCELSGAVADDLPADDEFVLGVRPEDVAPASGDTGTGLTATVEVVEPVGSDNYIYLDVADQFIARVDSTVEPAPGESMAVAFDESALHLFDTDTGEAVAVGERRAEAHTV
ncbi:ABC transporter ATP-binding protein [Haloarchaeobius litoreus]|uniref:ABC-type D-xylose/L-arabinose transporter n=1 Tax=Haloarchaeobius litoreus TaxID=755306 RepID=A0ABD6DFJ2_9EURY|nr:sn-glycerol-3-phosphate ABC transporter ATP-binding protein UgpC [Haloarchaeobius litoreus]